NLVKRLRADVADGIGAPEEIDSPFKLALPVFLLAGSHLFVLLIPDLQQVGDVACFCDQAASGSFSRMSGKDQFDRELIEEFLDGICGQTIFLQKLDQSSKGATL